MDGILLFEDNNLSRPNPEVLKILESSTLWDLLLFKSIVTLKSKHGLINQILGALDLIHISLGSLLHDCFDILYEEDQCQDELYLDLPENLSKVLGFLEYKKLKAKTELPDNYSWLFKDIPLIGSINSTESIIDEYEEHAELIDEYSGGSEDESSEVVLKPKRIKRTKVKSDFQIPETKECNKCHKKYSSINNARRHMKKCLNNDDQKLKVKFPDFVCVFCSTSYSTFIGFRNHVNSTCPKRPEEPSAFLCDKCKVFIFLPSGSPHDCQPYFKCDQCPFKCFNENHFRQHYRLVHLNVGTIYCCEICGKTFDSKTRLGNHLVVHTKERAFLCTECGKGFGRKSVLDVHMSVHFSHKVPCHICGKVFAHSNLVRKHMAAQHPKDGILTREQCPHCSSSFRSKFYLTKHIKHKHNPEENKDF